MVNLFKKLDDLMTSKTYYKAPKTETKDSSLRSKVVKPWKPPTYRNYKWGVGVGK